MATPHPHHNPPFHNPRRLEASFDHGLQRVWALSSKPGCNKLAIGCDKGTVVLKVGKDEPVFSMDSNGKIMYSNNHDVVQMNLKGNVPADIGDGEKITLAPKDIGTCEHVPKRLEHNSTGQYVVVVTEDEYTINSALAWRPQHFGKCQDFVWGTEAKTFAVLENSNTVKVYKSFKDAQPHVVLTDLGFSIDRLFGGHLLGCRGAEQIVFYDWETGCAIREIGTTPSRVCWNESGEMTALITDTSFFILKYNKQLALEALHGEEEIPEDGIADAFTLITEESEKVRQGSWVGDCFIYVSRNQRLNYYMGGEQLNLAVLERPMYLLGYVSKDNRVFLTDKTRNVVSYELFQAVIDFQTCVVRGELDTAMQKHLPKVPEEQINTIATFLDTQGYKEAALEVSKEQEHRFTLALHLHRLDLAKEILTNAGDDAANKLKWKQLGDLALQHAQFDLSEHAYTKVWEKRLSNIAKKNQLFCRERTSARCCCCTPVSKTRRDLRGLWCWPRQQTGIPTFHFVQNHNNNDFLLTTHTTRHTSRTTHHRHNIAFSAAYLIGDLKKCVQLLCDTERSAEAALFARTYIPELVPEAVSKWRKSLGTSKFASVCNFTAFCAKGDAESSVQLHTYCILDSLRTDVKTLPSQAIACPSEYPTMFPVIGALFESMSAHNLTFSHSHDLFFNRERRRACRGGGGRCRRREGGGCTCPCCCCCARCCAGTRARAHTGPGA